MTLSPCVYLLNPKNAVVTLRKFNTDTIIMSDYNICSDFSVSITFSDFSFGLFSNAAGLALSQRKYYCQSLCCAKLYDKNPKAYGGNGTSSLSATVL